MKYKLTFPRLVVWNMPQWRIADGFEEERDKAQPS